MIQAVEASSSTNDTACAPPDETLAPAAKELRRDSREEEVRSPDPSCAKPSDGCDAAVADKSSHLQLEGEPLVSPMSLGTTTIDLLFLPIYFIGFSLFFTQSFGLFYPFSGDDFTGGSVIDIDVEKTKSNGSVLNRPKKRQLKSNVGLAWGKLLSQCSKVYFSTFWF